MIVVGERINSSRPTIAQAIEKRDREVIQREALLQAGAGAHYIDVNAGTFLEDEPECLEWLVVTVQAAVDRPLCLDTPNPAALAVALRRHQGKPLVNSISAEKSRHEAMMPLLREHQCGVVALCVNDTGIPTTAAGRTKIAGWLIGELTAAGLPLEDIYVDPVIQPVSTDSLCGVVSLDTIAEVKKQFLGVRTICGLSNVSFGLPMRRQLNHTFAVLAMARGLDAAILDPTDEALTAHVFAAETLLGRDEYCMAYLGAYREGRLDHA